MRSVPVQVAARGGGGCAGGPATGCLDGFGAPVGPLTAALDWIARQPLMTNSRPTPASNTGLRQPPPVRRSLRITPPPRLHAYPPDLRRTWAQSSTAPPPRHPIRDLGGGHRCRELTNLVLDDRRPLAGVAPLSPRPEPLPGPNAPRPRRRTHRPGTDRQHRDEIPVIAHDDARRTQQQDHPDRDQHDAHKRQHRALHLGSRHVPSPISIARERFPRFADHRRR
ncbi:hypothetical protein Ae505Ps2_5878c [Pseudonocardia sp. Ae505_Ps2]|nr:hypothetical protein Ae505Ps2_5878c [Pseudonocardia sp. Ae505_Ps2]